MVVSAPAPGEGREKLSQISKQDLSSCRAGLVELMQSVNFGRIETLTIRNGQPVLDPRPRVVREHLFGGENGPRPECDAADFLLKRKVLDLFAMLDRLGNGVIDVLDVKHGLPFHATVTEVPA
ncbi:MAG: hypothetical protein NTW96_05460 [Planctomycetia bacterium]|nr:hypothetical protein [Planctomycetia bacterium]